LINVLLYTGESRFFTGVGVNDMHMSRILIVTIVIVPDYYPTF